MKPTGDPEFLNGLAAAYRSAAEELDGLLRATDGSAHRVLDVGWSGIASLAFLAEWGTHRTELRAGRDGLQGIAEATGRLASGLSDAQRRYRLAQSMVAAAGGSLDDSGSLTFPAAPQGPGVMDSTTLAQQVAEEAEAEGAIVKTEAAGEYESIKWTATLASLASQGLGFIDSGSTNLASQVAYATKRLNDARAELAAARSSADSLTKDASMLGRLMRTGTPEERSLAAGLIGRASQEAEAAWQTAADANAVVALKRAGVSALEDPTWARALNAVSPELKIARGIPILGAVANGVGFFGDLAEGNPWQEAGLRTGASWGASLLGAAGAVALVGVLGVTGVGEVIVVAAAAGAAAYIADQGVKYLYEHWDTVSAVPGQLANWATHEAGSAGGWIKQEAGNVWSGVTHLFGG